MLRIKSEIILFGVFFAFVNCVYSVSIRDCVHSGWCPFRMVSIRDGVHSGLCPFGIVSIRDCVHSGLCPFGMVSIRDCVHSGWCPFGIVSFVMVSIQAIVQIPVLLFYFKNCIALYLFRCNVLSDTVVLNFFNPRTIFKLAYISKDLSYILMKNRFFNFYPRGKPFGKG